MASVDGLMQGKLPEGLEYESPWSPSSPWSLVLAFVPESVAPKIYVRQLEECPLSSAGAGDAGAGGPEDDIVDYCRENNAKLGWTSTDETMQAVSQLFMQIRIRQLDAALGSIKWDSGSKHVASDWYNGILRPLTLLRDSYNSQLSLASFEAMAPAEAFQHMTAPLEPSNASHITRYILEPWCHYTKNEQLLSEWASTLTLEVCLRLTSIASISPSLVQSCYRAPFSAKLLQELAHNLGNAELEQDIAAGIILHPAKLSDVRDLRLGSELDKQRMLEQFVIRFPSPMAGIWEALDKLPLPSEPVEPLVIRELMHRKQFENLHSNRYTPQLIQQLASEYLERPGVDINSMIGAAALLPDQSQKKRFSAAKTLQDKYEVDAKVVLEASSGDQVLHKVLLHNQRAYQHKDLIDTINAATGGKLEEQYALSQLVEFALVDNNFSAAINFCERLDPKGEFAWLAYFQASKYRPNFAEYTSPKVLSKQRELIVTCLKICPPSDIEGVLRVYQQLQPQTQAQRPVQSTTTNQPHSEPLRAVSSGGRKRNLFVSSLGWAIGAPADD